MSAAAKRRLSISAALAIVIAAVLMLAFTPPSAVPYTLAAYKDRVKLINATGMNGLAQYASPAACAGRVNLYSQNVVYSAPVLSLPGRAGLGLSLSLTYNSKVWVKSGSTMYFDGDKGWPAPGWRLGFGRIDGKYDGTGNDDHYFLISGDGSVRDLVYVSGTKYESQDGTFIEFDDSTGILRYKDGTQVTYQTISGGGYVMPTQIKDRNGNYLTISYSENGQNISSVVDTLGRTTSFSYDGNGRLSTISKSGFGNSSRTWTFTYADLTLNYSFDSGLTVNGPASSTSIKVLQKITYPNSTDQYFTYNGYAQMTEAAFRSSNGTTRGKFTVAWDSAPGGGWTVSPTPASIGNNDGASSNVWTLDFNSYSTTVTGPDSVPHTTTFLSSPWDGLPDETTIGSTVLREIDRDWELDGSSLNPRISQVATTLKDAGVSNITSTVEYDYTSYNNVSEVREYDYGYSLKRKTTTTYNTGSDYTSRRILSLPDTVIVYNAGGTAKSRTVYDYDDGSLTSVSGASNHDGTNYGTGHPYRGNVTSVTRYTNAAAPSGAITNTMTYDMVGNLRTESADCCVTKTYNYSDTTEFSQPDSVVRGSTTTLTTEATYDSYTSLLATSEDENEKVTTYTYDTMNRITNVERSDGTDITTTYDDSSATASTTTTTPIDGSTSVKQKSEFDGLGRATRAITMDGSSTVYSKVDTVYDSMGRTWKVSLPYTSTASYWTETQYDALSRPTKVIPPDGSASANYIFYEYANDKITVTDQTGKKRKSQSDALGRQIKVTEPDPANSDSLTLETTYTYDPMNNVTQIDQGSQTRTYAYDDAGRKTSETTPEAGTVSYTYNNDNLLTTRTDNRGVVTTYSYDSALNRLTSISYNVSCCTSTVPSTPTVTYTYGTSVASNNNGRLIKMEDGLGEESYTYDSLGRTTQVAKKIYNVTYTTGYTYNLAGGGVNATYPSGRVVKHEYDNIGRLKNVKNNGTGASYVSNAAYSTANQLTGFTYGNSVAASYGYSANRLQLTSVSYGSLLSLSYSYSQSGNNNGQIASITDNQQSGRTATYTYDSLHRLKTTVTNGSAGYPQWGLSWSYDRYGNRTGQSVTHGSGPSSSPTISTSTNRITALGGSNYYYDSNGSLTQDDLFKYKYDAENRVVEIRNLSDTLLTSYAYDGHSMQVIKVAGGTRTWFLYAGGKLVSEYYDAASNTYSSPTSPGSAPSDSQSTLLYQHADHLTTRVTTDNAGTLSNQQAHYPYGEGWYNTGTADPSVPRKFTSYRKEDGSLASGQINYAIARYHGARIGRFHRPDPILGNVKDNPQRFNRYSYVLADPVLRTDPTGEDEILWYDGWYPGQFLPGEYPPIPAFEGYTCFYPPYIPSWIPLSVACGDVEANLLDVLERIACSGTKDCSYYKKQCRNLRKNKVGYILRLGLTSYAEHLTYYCVAAPPVCKNAGDNSFSNCVRLCLQTADDCFGRVFTFPSCQINLHERCFARCAACVVFSL